LMATASKVQCTKCAKNSAITACEGCSSKLCRRCFNDHRQDLSKELDNIVYEHDMLKEQLETPNENNSHRLLKQIDQWKKDSIDKVNQLADQCRTDVVKLLDKDKDERIDRFRKMTSRVRKGQDDEDYDERDLSKWMTALKELKDELIKPSNFCVEEDKEQPSWIQKIRVRENVPEQVKMKDDAASMSSVRSSHTATLLSSGKVLVAGGYIGGNYLSSSEVYDPPSNTWTPVASMSSVRYLHTATLLSSGKVLVTGGYVGGNYLSSSE
ncbi:unnamed protein product, partial [Didymodactylos carnosus]